MMELERNKTQSESDLASKSMAMLEKHHNIIVARVEPSFPEPPPLVHYLVLGNAKSNKLEGILSGTFLGVGCVSTALIVSLSIEGIVNGFLAGSFAIGMFSAMGFAINNFFTLDEKAPSIGYRLQKAWQKRGLPAKKLKLHEYEIALQNVKYHESIAQYKNGLRELEEEFQPALDYMNAKSPSYYYSFNSEGLKVASKQPSSLEVLAKETSSIIAEDSGKNLKLEIGA